MAPYGLLFHPKLTDSWEYITLLTPPGYAQRAYSIPPEFDRIMADLGYKGFEPEDIVENRLVRRVQAQRDIRVDRIEVWREGEPCRTLRALSPALATEALSAEEEQEPVEPFLGEPLRVAIWRKGVDPFPEAVRPSEYLYYSADATASGRGVLVPVKEGAVYNGTLGKGPPFYPVPELDRLLREAASGEPEASLPDSS